MALVRFQYEPVSLDVSEVCFDEEQDITNTRERSRKGQSDAEWCRCGKCGVMDTNIEYLSCREVEALGYSQYAISELARPSYIPWIYFVGGAS